MYDLFHHNNKKCSHCCPSRGGFFKEYPNLAKNQEKMHFFHFFLERTTMFSDVLSTSLIKYNIMNILAKN